MMLRSQRFRPRLPGELINVDPESYAAALRAEGWSERAVAKEIHEERLWPDGRRMSLFERFQEQVAPKKKAAALPEPEDDDFEAAAARRRKKRRETVIEDD